MNLMSYLRRIFGKRHVAVGGPQFSDVTVSRVKIRREGNHFLFDPPLNIPPRSKVEVSFWPLDGYADVITSPLPENYNPNEAEKPAGGNA